MKLKAGSKPEVFIVESLRFSEEANEQYEGRLISQMLRLSGKHCRYFYIRTKKEFKKVVEQFAKSKYRYLHLSCHGNPESLFTTLDPLDFPTLAEIIKPHLAGRRLFLSSCLATNEHLAKTLMKESKCISILGPAEEVDFDDAAILWASLYHIMFSAREHAMKHAVLHEKAQEVSTMFGVTLNYIKSQTKPPGYFIEKLRPKRKQKN